jgi:hypothetical protein
MAGRLAGLAVLLLACAAGVSSRATALLTDGEPVGANTFSTAESFGPDCPATPPAGVAVMLGFESGVVTSAGLTSGFFGVEQASLSVDGTIARGGASSLEVTPSGAPGFGVFYLSPTTVTTARFALQLDTLPATDIPELFSISNATGGSFAALLGYEYNAGAPTFSIRLRDGTGVLTAPVESSVEPAAGQWYLVDIHYDATGTTHTVAWRVDGSDQPAASQPGDANTQTSLGWVGTTVASTFSAHYDDIVISTAAADYPLPDATVRRLVPDGAEPSNLLGSITNETGGTGDAATWWQKLDDVPVASADFIRQDTVDTAAYAAFSFADTTDTCILAVLGRVFATSAGSSIDARSEFRVLDGAITRSVWNQTLDVGDAGFLYGLGAFIPPAGPSWTTDELNGLVGRIGFASDIPSGAAVPRWDALGLEYLTPYSS